MNDLIPGTRYTRNGIRFTVQFVEGDWVYGVRFRADVTPEEINRIIDDGGEPPGYLGNCRVRREDFAKEVAGAAVEFPAPVEV